MNKNQDFSLLSSKKFLVVDDNQDSNDLACMLLKSIGVNKKNIITAINGPEAVQRAKQEVFDVIIMDIYLPLMDGVQASQQIQSHYNGSSPKIIAYTANQFAAKEDEIVEAFDDIMIKPIGRATIREAIINVLNPQNMTKKDFKTLKKYYGSSEHI